ncbi:hypothetical protein D3C72_1116620 [compost metagenome]
MGELHGTQTLAQGRQRQVSVGADHQVIEGAAIEAHRLALEYPGDSKLPKLRLQGVESGSDVVLPFYVRPQADIDAGHQLALAAGVR